MQGAIFDMDGLLLDTERIYQEGWTECAKNYVDQVNLEVGRACAGSSGEQIQKVIQKYYPGIDEKALNKDVIQYYQDRVLDDLQLKKGVIEILDYFKSKGIKMAVASSSIESIIHSNLEKVGILSYFDSIVSAQHVKRSKPNPDIFLKAVENLNLQAEACYVFEDAINGVKAGLNAGCKTIMIPDTQKPIDEFYQSCYGIFSSLIEAMESIKKDIE